MEEILSRISRCREFDQISLRMGDRTVLNALNRPRNGNTGIRFPVPGLIQTVEKKINWYDLWYTVDSVKIIMR